MTDAIAREQQKAVEAAKLAAERRKEKEQAKAKDKEQAKAKDAPKAAAPQMNVEPPSSSSSSSPAPSESSEEEEEDVEEEEEKVVAPKKRSRSDRDRDAPKAKGKGKDKDKAKAKAKPAAKRSRPSGRSRITRPAPNPADVPQVITSDTIDALNDAHTVVSLKLARITPGTPLGSSAANSLFEALLHQAHALRAPRDAAKRAANELSKNEAEDENENASAAKDSE